MSCDKFNEFQRLWLSGKLPVPQHCLGNIKRGVIEQGVHHVGVLTQQTCSLHQRRRRTATQARRERGCRCNRHDGRSRAIRPTCRRADVQAIWAGTHYRRRPLILTHAPLGSDARQSGSEQLDHFATPTPSCRNVRTISFLKKTSCESMCFGGKQ
jgi:hypothetical protein